MRSAAKRPRRIFLAAFVVLLCCSRPAASTGFADQSVSAPVQLPEFLVTADSPWRYARCGSLEVLSRCKDDDTATKWLTEFAREVAIVRSIFPQGFLPRNDLPALFIVYEDSNVARTTENWAGAVVSDRSDYDLPIYFINIEWFRTNSVKITENEGYALPSAMRYMAWLVDCRKPRAPAWLCVGLQHLLEGRVFCKTSARVRMEWIGGWRTKQLFGDTVLIESTLDVKRLFDAWSEVPQGTQDVPKALKQETAHFVFWALQDSKYKDGFWKFVQRASEEKVSEHLFRDCFGVGFAEATERAKTQLLKWNLAEFHGSRSNKHVLGTVTAPVHVPPIEIRRASSAEIGRIVGEWRRQVAMLNPEGQIRTTALQGALKSMNGRAPNSKANAPFLAALGLCERDAGMEAEALEHLGRAIRDGVERPRAYLEYARLKYDAELHRLSVTGAKLTPVQTHSLLEPLLAARRQSPQLPGVYSLITEIWSRSSERPSNDDLAVIQEGTQFFPRETEFMLAAARLHHLLGRDNEAAEIANRWLRATNSQTRTPAPYRPQPTSPRNGTG